MNYRYYNYFTEIEEYFVSKRGKHMLVSPLDWSLMESWKQVGIPLHVVLRGMDRAFQKHEAHASGRRINSIFYCQPAVMECFDEYQQARIGEAGDDAVDDQAGSEKLALAIRKLQQQLGEVSGGFPDQEAVRRTRQMLADLLTEIVTGKPPVVAAVEETLQVCDSILVEGTRRHLTPERLEAFQKEAKQELKIYKRRVTAEMYARIRENFVKRRIREESGIPEFTLFFLS
ncbi:MAG: hypothetical protein HY315_04440 [Acidobacteria bacterium]|nr:hypothetical protein [Acidobacteriota bacterium]